MLDPATVIWERNGDYLFAHHALLLLRDRRVTHLRLRWDWKASGWFLVGIEYG